MLTTAIPVSIFKKLLLAICLLSSVLFARPQTFNPQLATLLQDTLDHYVQQVGNIKGMSAGVYIPGQGAWIGVAGNSHTGQPLDRGMRMGIASNSKLFVAAIMLKLAEKNIISLDDPLSRWLQVFPNVNPAITIRQLLNHSSGVSDPLFIPPWMDTINAYPTRMFTPNEVIGWLGAPYFPAGTGYAYSNINYILAGMIAKNATGFSISRLIRDSILTALNMDSTFYDVEEPAAGPLAHRWWNNIDYHDTSRTGLNSAGGCAGSIFSTVSEMLQWYTALMGGQIITANSLQAMTTFIPTPSPTYQYGLGISRETTQSLTYWGHGGSTWGYRSKIIYDSCLKTTVCGLTNCFPSGVEGVTFLLYRVVKNHVPGCSGPVNGTAVVCRNTNGVNYTVPLIPNASSYVWELPAGASGSSNTNSISVNFGSIAVTGDITVRGVNNYGPGGSSVFRVVVSDRPPTPVISQAGNLLSSDAATGNQWFSGAGIIPGATSPTYTITSSGLYYCIVTVAGCSSAPSNTINAVLTGILPVGNGGVWKMAPNPAREYFFTQVDGIPYNDMYIRIYSLSGIMLHTEKIIQTRQRIKIRKWPPGVYIAELRWGKYHVRQKILVL